MMVMMNRKTKRILLGVLWLVSTLFFLGIIQQAISNTDLYTIFLLMAIRSSDEVTNTSILLPAILYYTIPIIATLDHLGKFTKLKSHVSQP